MSRIPFLDRRNFLKVSGLAAFAPAISTPWHAVAQTPTPDSKADHTLRIPTTKFDFLNALLSAIPMQMLAYHVARLNGCEIDQPRNLAKSVTVE